MEAIKGQNIGILPFKDLKKVSDLIYFEGPILSHFKDHYNNHIIFYWVDYDNSSNRWIVFQTPEKLFLDYLRKNKSLRDLFDHPVNGCFYTLELKNKLEYHNIQLIFQEDLPKKYYPEEESYYNNPLPEAYSKLVTKIDDEYFIETIQEKAIYFKVEPKNLKSSTVVGVFGATEFLNAMGTSFINFMEYSVIKDFGDKLSGDLKRLNAIIRALKEDMEPKIVDTSISSFAVAIGPNNNIKSPNDLINIDWKEQLFRNFKENVVELDFQDSKKVNAIIKKYDENKRIEIFKPLIDVYNSKKIKIEITDRHFKNGKKIKPIKKEIAAEILKKSSEHEPEELTLTMGLVQISTKKRSKPKVVDLFDNKLHDPVFSTTSVITPTHKYTLNRKIFVEYIRDKEFHLLENRDLGIFVHGVSLEEAEKLFYEEFEYIYERYNSLKEEELTEDVKQIKYYLNSIVKES